MRLSLIEQIIQACQYDVHFIQLFSVKHPEIYISEKRSLLEYHKN